MRSLMMGIRSLWAALLLFCLTRADPSMRASIVQGEVSQRDTSRPWYRLRLPGDDTARELKNMKMPAGASKMRMVSAQGQVLQCVVPSPPPSDVQVLDGDSQSAFDDVDYILRNYENKCFVREEGWWTFEFCYNKEVVQVHKARDDDDEETKYVLGSFNKDLDVTRRKNPQAIAKSGSPYTQLYGNGTECAETGRPREIVVKYICANDAMHMATIQKETGEVFLVKGIRELATCVYELEFISTAICEQKLYRSTATRNDLEIKCELEEGQGAFRGLSAKRYRRASLTL